MHKWQSHKYNCSAHGERCRSCMTFARLRALLATSLQHDSCSANFSQRLFHSIGFCGVVHFKVQVYTTRVVHGLWVSVLSIHHLDCSSKPPSRVLVISFLLSSWIINEFEKSLILSTSFMYLLVVTSGWYWSASQGFV